MKNLVPINKESIVCTADFNKKHLIKNSTIPHEDTLFGDLLSEYQSCHSLSLAVHYHIASQPLILSVLQRY